MDFQNRVGSKKGGGGVASASHANADRRERLRKLALDTIDLSKDPYFLKVRPPPQLHKPCHRRNDD